MISRYWCQYRVPISGVPISGYDSHRYRSQYQTRYWVLFLVFHADDEVPANPRGELQGVKKYGQQKKQGIKVMSFLPEQRNQSLYPEFLTPCRDSNPEPLPSNRHALPLSHHDQAK
jgi:hypothetical protein